MSKEELLKPRVKVMGYYPHSPYEIGDVLTFQKNDPDDLFDTSTYSGGNGREYADEVEKSPLIFQPLPWYAERDIKDMPEYVKYPSERTVKAKWEWNQQEQCYLAQSGYSNSVIEPATIEEYNAHINSKK